MAGWTEKIQSTFQSQTCTKKRLWSLVVCCWSDPLQLSDPGKNITSEKYAQQIDEMYWKLQHLQLALINRKHPVLLHDNTWPNITQSVLQKLNKLGYEILPHLPYSPDLLPTDCHFFKHLDNFLQGKCFNNQQEAGSAFQEFVKSQSMYFYATGANKRISQWRKCVDWMVPVLINKDVFESS